jgi:hypothetical protein
MEHRYGAVEVGLDFGAAGGGEVDRAELAILRGSLVALGGERRGGPRDGRDEQPDYQQTGREARAHDAPLSWSGKRAHRLWWAHLDTDREARQEPRAD